VTGYWALEAEAIDSFVLRTCKTHLIRKINRFKILIVPVLPKINQETADVDTPSGKNYLITKNNIFDIILLLYYYRKMSL